MSVAHAESFKLIKTTPLENIKVELQEFEHIKTGAKHYHFAADNTENAFMVTLRTMPEDSTGVAHILEHTALCGSKNFKVRDPFFSMAKRSLNSFMNAMTSTDWTSYPFASSNKKDYDNLLRVYLDAVFFPNLDELAFKQEGHRLDFAESGNIKSDLIFKGIVFNEMKGAMDVNSYIYKEIFASLFPHDTYAVNSGGEPENIPDLTYENFVAFHKKHYHPSNAIFFTYGDITAEENQRRFEELALKDFNKLDVRFEVKSEPAFTAPKYVEMPYACDDEDLSQKTYLQLAWCIGEATDAYEALKAEFLEMVLVSDSSAPLRAALESSEIGKAPYLLGLSDDQKQMVFMAGLMGSEVEHKEEFEKVVFSALKKVAEEGVNKQRIEALLDQLEYASRNLETGSYPFGLSLMRRSMNNPVHYKDLTEVLDIDPLLERLRQDAESADFIPNMVKDLLIENNHRVTLVAQPDAELRQKRVEKEKARLAAIKANLSEEELQQIVKQAEELEAYQNSEEDLSVLPKVTLEDVSKEVSWVYPDLKAELTAYKAATNGIVVQRISFDIPSLTEQELKLMPFYVRFATSLGVGDKTYNEIAEEQTAACRYFNMADPMNTMIDAPDVIKGKLCLSARGLARKQDQMVDLMVKTIKHVRFDEYQRIRELLVQYTESAEQSLERGGHVVAVERAFSGFSKSARLHQIQGGIESVAFAKELVKKTANEKELKAFASSLEALHKKITASSAELLLVVDEANFDTAVDTFVSKIKEVIQTTEKPEATFEVKEQSVNDIWAMNTSVNFCAKAYKAVPYMHEDAPKLHVLAPYLSQAFLHKEIREKGGAYGGGALFRSGSGFGFYSYRDPEVEKTLATYDAAIDWMLEAEHKAEDLESAILAVVSKLDQVKTPIAEALSVYGDEGRGLTEERFKAYRSAILSVTLDDLKEVTRKYLKDQKHQTAVLSNAKTATEKAKSLGLTLIKL